ncbi:MAG: PD-(D/E)XK nuclease family protein [Gammaproteobacteria bacterium]|nr:PD-(D/E)XK nuclease family protein [Gammaproteobacteria bacterium]
MLTTQSISPCEPFLQTLAEQILQANREQLPDLSHIRVFIPNALAAHQLRQTFTQQTASGLLGPYIGSMQQWISDNIPLPTGELQQINAQARQLLILEALQEHPDLFNPKNTWQVCDSLLNLFSELTLNNHALLNNSLDQWNIQLQQAYKSHNQDPAANQLVHLNREAKLVYQLWQAWQEQMQALKLTDSDTAYIQRLHLHLQQHTIPAADCFYIIGPEQLNAAELKWCGQIQSTHEVIFFTQGTAPETENIKQIESTNLNSYSVFLNHAYSQQQSLKQRSALFSKTFDSHSIKLPCCLLAARSAEQEAQAVELQVRLWLLENKKNIGIVSEDRKLARRVRALLERSNIVIQDTAGWSLSTTSATTVIERWLECIEQDFAYQPLLDLLKSPFYCDDEHREQHLSQVFRLQQDIIIHENISSDINRYQQALTARKKRLSHWSPQSFEFISQLLNQLEQISTPLRKLQLENKPVSPEIYLQTLCRSLEQLNIDQRLQNDIAGRRILQELNNMRLGLKQAQPEMTWQDFRSWLGNTLEQEQFKPQNTPAVVQLINMKQAQYCNFDALIITSANKDSLPGYASQSPFFNQAVRQSLGLSSWPEEKAYRFYRFRNLLEAAPEVLITYKTEHNGEWLQASPWVSSLSDFATLALATDLHNHSLQQLVTAIDSKTNCDISTKPAIPRQATPVVAQKLIPAEYSASRYQRLINCPYQFFAADCLSLKASEKITEELLKSEYGEKIHLILHAFHQQLNGFPAPFKLELTTENRDSAIDHLLKLSRQVFEKDIEDNVQHRGWFERWSDTAIAYIDWQIKRQKQWHIHQLEQQLSVDIDPQTQLKGRLDRIEKQQHAFSVIDYKTGTPPAQKNVNQGEDVQLVSYAKLLNNVNEVAYLKLDRGEVKIAAHLEDQQLHELKQLSLQRLQQLISDIKQGHAVTSWGDDDSCSYCDMQGLCRKQIWGSL